MRFITVLLCCVAAMTGHAMALAETGRGLVRLLVASNDLAATPARTEALVPLVTVGVVEDDLPLATDSVNLVFLVAETPVDEAEAERVLAPEGVLLSGSPLVAATMPVNDQYGGWTHFDADAHATGVAADTWIPTIRIRIIDSGKLRKARLP